MAIGDPHRWMWGEACALLEQAERLQRQFFSPSRVGASGTSWEPPVDMFESDRALWIIIALPGVSPEGVELFLEANKLIVVGRRTLPREARGAAIYRLELPHGRFERQIPLPARRWQLGQREFANGCLVLRLIKE
jgi:HSP20 family molecular chaperone IbpA